MTAWPILSLLIFLPLAGAFFILTIRESEGEAANNARALALWTSGVTFAISIALFLLFDADNPDFQFVEEAAWLAGGITYRVGIDGISLALVLLTTLLVPLCILASGAIQKRVREYMVAFLIMESLMLGVFCALDLVVFYLFFEGGLIPMFLIIGVWGGPRRVYASFKFFLYTLLGSLLMLIAIVAIYLETGTTDIARLLDYNFPADMQTWLWLAFFASFAVKLPMWPVHTWLPDAHVEAPTAGSVILAGVLLKMGAYGFLRFSLPMFPLASADFAPFMLALSVVAIVYTSLVALAQEDIKKLIAYSSVAHMGFVTMGLFAMTPEGLHGGFFQMLSHGWVSAALFLCAGVLYDRMHSRDIAGFGGVVQRMPIYAFAFMVFILANIGLPGTSGFVGEFLAIVGVFKVSVLTAALAVLGVILSAAYALWLYGRIMFGGIDNDNVRALVDIGWRDIIILAPLLLATLGFGIYPAPVSNLAGAALDKTTLRYERALDAREAR